MIDHSRAKIEANYMDHAYWVSRKKASIANAECATDSNARLVHFDLAGRYDLKAVEAMEPLPMGAKKARN